MCDPDYLYAMELQRQLDEEDSMNNDIEEVFLAPSTSRPNIARNAIKRSNPHSNLDDDYLNRTQNLVHPEWETLDPTPNINALFSNFDQKFFQGRLACVALEWSKRMYSCAGICYYKKNNFGKAITVRLSEPLLKLRPRKDLVETMLHEMIHAYCFVLNIREGNGGHGPNFKKIMNSINKVAGTNITVYHSFHDEVQHYKQYWWRCNGVCQNRSPFYGYVKRSSNRAPSANDQWWPEHMKQCGGIFLKIKGPDLDKKVQGKSKGKAGVGADIRNFFNNTKTTNNTKTLKSIKSATVPPNVAFDNKSNGTKGPMKINGGGTMVLNPKTKTTTNNTIIQPTSTIAKAFPPTSYPGVSTDPFNMGNNSKVYNTKGAIVPPGGNLRNVMGFRDLTSNSFSGTKTKPAMTGHGYTLSNVTTTSPQKSGNQADRNRVRDAWLKRFGDSSDKTAHQKGNNTTSNNTANTCKIDSDTQLAVSGDSKRRRISIDGEYMIMSEDNNDLEWAQLDDDVLVKEEKNEIIVLSDSDDTDTEVEEVKNSTPAIPLTAEERQSMIKKEILDESELNDDDIILIDDEFDDNFDAAIELADTSVIDEFFSDDTLLKDFKLQNDVIPTGSRYIPNANDEIITCPICQTKMKRSDLSEHLNGCTGIASKLQKPTKLKFTPKKSNRRSNTPCYSARDLLLNAGYKAEDLTGISSPDSSDDLIFDTSQTINSTTYVNLDSSDENTKQTEQSTIFNTPNHCPSCGTEIADDILFLHISQCKPQI